MPLYEKFLIEHTYRLAEAYSPPHLVEIKSAIEHQRQATYHQPPTRLGISGVLHASSAGKHASAPPGLCQPLRLSLNKAMPT
jgi:hypothetical protein